MGYRIFHHFSGGKVDELIPDWMSGRLSTRDCLRREAEMSRLTSEDLDQFLLQFEVDPTFPAFVRACEDQQIPFTILSEGMDLYIKRLLAKAGLEHLTTVSNLGRIEGDRLRIDFPRENKTCTRCGTCKGEVIRECRESYPAGTKVVFVGDGLSDACAAREADLVFAKKDLADYCLGQQIKYLSYDDFNDVMSRLNSLGLLTVSPA